MPISMGSLVIVSLLVAVTAVGDFYIKTATHLAAPFSSWQFGIGFLTYALGAFGWFYAMKYMSLAEIGVIYSCLTIIILSLLGVFVFKEGFSIREYLGVGLAISAVLVMHDWRPTFAYFAQLEY